MSESYSDWIEESNQVWRDRMLKEGKHFHKGDNFSHIDHESCTCRNGDFEVLGEEKIRLGGEIYTYDRDADNYRKVGAECIKCLNQEDHPWHDDGTIAGETENPPERSPK